MDKIYEALMLLGAGAGIAIVCVLVGAFIMFRGRAGIGERFIGGAPKGQVFTIPEETEEFPDVEKNVLQKTAEFLKVFEGKSQGS